MKANEVMRVRRLELGLTQREIADRVGVTEATVSRWESGDIRNMRRDKIAALARATKKHQFPIDNQCTLIYN